MERVNDHNKEKYISIYRINYIYNRAYYPFGKSNECPYR